MSPGSRNHQNHNRIDEKSYGGKNAFGGHNRAEQASEVRAFIPENRSLASGRQIEAIIG